MFYVMQILIEKFNIYQTTTETFLAEMALMSQILFQLILESNKTMGFINRNFIC